MAIEPSESELAWLEDAVAEGLPYSKMAAHMGCCTDTLKRILHREGIVEFEGAKYQSRTLDKPVMWDRPCMRCKDETPRPKWQYFCARCSDLNERIESQVGDIFDTELVVDF